MKPSRLLVVVLASLLAAAPASAQDAPEGPSYGDIVAMLKDKNAALKMDLVQKAVDTSVHTWRPKDVYEVLDLGATPPVARAAAAKANMFWDGSAKPLQKVREEARGRAAAETVRITSNEDLVMVFETFAEVQYGLKAAEKEVGPLKPRESWEDDVKFDMRKRAHDVSLAQALGPHEGRIEKTTFEAELTGGFTPHDGSCTQPHVSVDLSQVAIDTYRYAMGGRRMDVPIAIAGNSNVESARWAASGGYRFEAYGKAICGGSSSSLAAQGSKLKITLTRPLDSDAWSATATFHNAKTNARL